MQHLDRERAGQTLADSPRTLERWRRHGKGPRYLKVESRVIYPMPEVEAYETASLHANTVGPIADRVEDAREGA